MTWIYLLIGALAAGPLWLLLARWRLLSSFRRVRRLAAASRRQEHLVEVGTLVGGLAHEIKNPLSTVKVNLQLLQEDLGSPTADEPQRRWLRRLMAVSNEVTRLQEVLDDFLRFAGRHELHPVNLDLRQIVIDLAEFFRPQAEAARVRVRLAMPEEPLYVLADVDLLKQALLNLMINAQQAMPEGGELILKAAPLRRKVQLEVIDTGAGMTPDVVAHIFEAYYTTKRGGTGLGLPTVMRIVREHEGTISVDTAAGKGTRFVITLPAGEKPRAPQPGASA